MAVQVAVGTFYSSKKFFNVYIIDNNAKLYIYMLHIFCFNIAYRNLHQIIGFLNSKSWLGYILEEFLNISITIW